MLIADVDRLKSLRARQEARLPPHQEALSLGSSYSAPNPTAICSKLAHALENDRGQLHDLLIQYRVFLNLALDAIAVGVQLLS